MKKILNINYFLILLIFLFPFFLTTGPAIPDITLTIISLIFLFYIIKNSNYSVFNQSWFKIGLALWLWFIIISFFAYDKKISFSDAIIFIRFLIFIIAIQYIIINEKVRSNLFKVIFVFSILVTIDSYYQLFNYDPEFGFLNDIFGRMPDGLYGRLSGPFKDLVPGSVLTKFFFLSLLLIKINENRIKNNKLLYLSTFIIFSFIITIIYFSGERIAYASLLLGIAIVIFFSKNLRKILLLSIFFSLIISFFIYNFHPIYQNIKIIESTAKHEGLTIEKEYTCKNNIEEKCKKLFKVQPKFIEVLRNFKGSAYGEIYLTATKIWMDNKFFGIGLNNFTSVCKNELQYNKFHPNFPCTTHPHNFYIQALVESGIIGLILFSLLICSFIVTIINSKQDINYKLIFVVSLIVVFWPIMSTGSFLKNWHMTTVSYLVGICLTNPKKIKIFN